MQTFDDVLSQVVALLRRSDAGGFVPHPAKGAKGTKVASRRATRSGTAVVSYRDVYHCPASTWGEGAFVPKASDPSGACRSATLSTVGPTAGSTGARSAGPSVRMPFRIFDEP